MRRNRLPETLPVYRLPQPSSPAPSADAFVPVPVVLLPVTLDQLVWQQWLYRQAFEQAQAAARPSLPERDLLGMWN